MGKADSSVVPTIIVVPICYFCHHTDYVTMKLSLALLLKNKDYLWAVNKREYVKDRLLVTNAFYPIRFLGKRTFDFERSL